MEPWVGWIALVIALIAFSAHSAETADPVGETSDALSDCSGFYLFLARAPQSQSKPATVNRLLEFAKDATLAATYLLTLEQAKKHAHQNEQEKQKVVQEVLKYVKRRVDSNKSRMEAAIEREDFEQVDAEMKRCTSLTPLREEIVQQMRNDALGRFPPKE